MFQGDRVAYMSQHLDIYFMTLLFPFKLDLILLVCIHIHTNSLILKFKKFHVQHMTKIFNYKKECKNFRDYTEIH